MQILFKCSVEGEHGLTGKKSSKQRRIFGMISLLFLSHGKCFVYYFLRFPNSLSFPSVSVYSVKRLTPLPFPFLSQTTTEFFCSTWGGAENSTLLQWFFFASCALYWFRLRVNLSSYAAGFWICDQNGAGCFTIAILSFHSKTFTGFNAALPERGLGCAKHREGGQLTPTDQRDILHHDIRLSNKIWVKNEEREKFAVLAFFFPCNLFVLKPCFPGNG